MTGPCIQAVHGGTVGEALEDGKHPARELDGERRRRRQDVRSWRRNAGGLKGTTSVENEMQYRVEQSELDESGLAGRARVRIAGIRRRLRSECLAHGARPRYPGAPGPQIGN
jgi:hypothetical protein